MSESPPIRFSLPSRVGLWRSWHAIDQHLGSIGCDALVVGACCGGLGLSIYDLCTQHYMPGTALSFCCYAGAVLAYSFSNQHRLAIEAIAKNVLAPSETPEAQEHIRADTRNITRLSMIAGFCVSLGAAALKMPFIPPAIQIGFAAASALTTFCILGRCHALAYIVRNRLYAGYANTKLAPTG